MPVPLARISRAAPGALVAIVQQRVHAQLKTLAVDPLRGLLLIGVGIVGRSHHHPPKVSRATPLQITAQSPNDSSNTKISAAPRLRHAAALHSSIPCSPTGRRDRASLHHFLRRNLSAGPRV